MPSVRNPRRFAGLPITALLLLAGAGAQAGVVMYGTRVLYPSGKHFVTVRLANQDQAANLLQAWVDDGRGVPPEEESAAPFVVTPPLFRIGPEGQQSVRAMFSGGAALPTDRESLYWFNYLQIPPDSPTQPRQGAAQISISFLNQVKLIYRPPTVKGDVLDLPTRLEFALSRNGKEWRLTASNPTGFHATFVDRAQVESGAASLPVAFGDQVTLAPFSSLSWRVADAPAGIAAPTLAFSLIDDAGVPRAHRKAVAVASQAR